MLPLRYAMMLCLSLLTMFASTAGAQLIDFQWPDPGEDSQKAEAEPTPPAKPAPRAKRDQRALPEDLSDRAPAEVSPPEPLVKCAADDRECIGIPTSAAAVRAATAPVRSSFMRRFRPCAVYA